MLIHNLRINRVVYGIIENIIHRGGEGRRDVKSIIIILVFIDFKSVIWWHFCGKSIRLKKKKIFISIRLFVFKRNSITVERAIKWANSKESQ